MEYPLTSAQKTFYPKGLPMDRIMWNIGMAILFRKQYTPARLEAALRAAAAAFQELRLCFAERNGTPYAWVSEEIPRNFPNLGFLSRQERMAALQELIDEPFDMAGPLYRCAIFDGPDGHGVFLCAHHIVIDGFGVQIVAQFIHDYLENSGVSGKILSYEEHFAQEWGYRGTKRFLRDWQYWREQLSVPMDPLFQVGRNSIRYAARELVTEPDPQWMERIHGFCEIEGITPAAFFSTVLAVWLRREYGHATARLGLSVMNRTTAAELHSAGLFMRILPLMVSTDGPGFADCARRTEEQKMDLFRHQRMTRSEIEDLWAEQGSGRKAPFEVVFDYQEFPECAGMELIFSYSSALSVPLEIHFLDHGHRQKLHIRYRTALFSEEQIRDLSQQFVGIAAAAVETPQVSPDQLPRYTLSAEVRQTLLEKWNSTQHNYGIPENATLYSLFEAYAERHPADICLYAGSGSLTFQELRSRAEMLDSAIRRFTGDKKSVIALIAERSVEMYTAVYGIIRGGNAYLPIDPTYPPERIDAILRSSGAAAVLAQQPFGKLAGTLPCVDITEFFNRPHSGLPIVSAAARPEDTAYVIYTSGSTGEPKGAMICHRSAVNRILWMQEAYPLDAGSVILQKTPITFDVSVWELFWWGICGGRLAACAPGEHFLPAKILQAISTHGVTHLHFVPSVFELFLAYLEEDSRRLVLFSSVRHVFLSGEALSAALIQRFYGMFPYPLIRLHNLYGPTECAVDVTYYDCVPEDVDPVPIGRPIFNTSTYILDSSMNLLPPGKRGQLCIGGVNVGQGYRNAPELTAERFVDNPFGSGKLYKTGDFASFREDGQILFHGRMDGQLKLHGQRIETGEIEAVICGTPGVESAVVIPCRKEKKEFLCAFYCGEPGQNSHIEKQCRKILPSYMIPARIVHLDRFPLNGSGKLDRRALRDLVPETIEETAYQMPCTPEEKLVCEAFSQILNCASVGRHNNFFDLGGSSLDMIALLSRREFEGISAAEFISDPTAEALAKRISASECRHGWLQLLHRGSDPGKTLILFPYAGGQAESFAAFTHCAAELDPALWVYCVAFPHSRGDCRDIARELGKLSENTALYVYSHCAGIAPALQVMTYLGPQNTKSVRHYFAAAAIPPEEPPSENPWDGVPDAMLRSVLEGAGASFSGLSDQQIADMFARFRRDTGFYTEFFRNPPPPVSVPMTLFLSKEDPFTGNYTEAGNLWVRYASNLENIQFVDSQSHYFHAEQPGTLLQTICEIISQAKTAAF